jgi:hypothetical protein
MKELVELVTSKELDDYLLRGERADYLADRADYLSDERIVVTFTFTQSVEYDAAEIVGLSDREIIERARELVASQYDGDLIDGAHLLLGDADADLENMRGAQ